jgi:competence protein ComEC
MYIYPLLEARFVKISNWGGLKETVLMSVAAQIAVAPLLAYDFHLFSLVSIPANLLLLPLMPYTMLFGFLTGLLGLIAWPLGHAIGLFSWLLSVYQIYVIEWFGSLKIAAVTVTMSAVVLCILYTLIIFGIWSINNIDESKIS